MSNEYELWVQNYFNSNCTDPTGTEFLKFIKCIGKGIVDCCLEWGSNHNTEIGVCDGDGNIYFCEQTEVNKIKEKITVDIILIVVIVVLIFVLIGMLLYLRHRKRMRDYIDRTIIKDRNMYGGDI